MSTPTQTISEGQIGEFLRIDGARLHYLSAGSGPPVVLVHGNAGFLQDFSQTVLQRIAKDFLAIAIDRPGHGRSERPSVGPATLGIQADILNKLLHELNVGPHVIVGHSWGGALALAYALNYPREVEALVLIAPAAYPSADSFGIHRALATVPILGDLIITLGSPFIRREIERRLKQAFSPDEVPPEYLRLAEDIWMKPESIRAIIEDDVLLDQSLNLLYHRYGEIRKPVTIITGDRDLEVEPVGNAYRLHEAIPGSKLVIVPEAGHELLHTHGDVVVDEIRSIALACK